MATSQPAGLQTDPTRPSRPSASRRQLVAAGIIGALVAAFALANLGNVKVHWLFWTHETPLIVVVVLSFLLGILADRLVLVRAKRKQRSES